MTLPAVVVVMGVSGSGKSTIGARLAQRLGWRFADGDDFHSDANIAKMHGGVPLTDDDRQPWLDAIAHWIDDTRRSGGHGVVACSALKRRYRDGLIGDRTDVRLVYLLGDESTISHRLAGRHGHFMPAALLRSQFEQLEEPTADEHPIVVPIQGQPDDAVARIVSALNIADGPPA
jgi:carbohydrate kinase (thermoresistant glucokinase family)